MSKIEIKEAYNGWIIESSGESRSEPRVFEYDGTNKFRTTLENRMDTALRALTHVLSNMLGTTRYQIVISDKEEEDDKPTVPVVDSVPAQTFRS